MGSQAAGLRRSVQAHPEEEVQDHQEAGPQGRVHRLQVEEPVPDQAHQALRAGRREEEEGTDDPVLGPPPPFSPFFLPTDKMAVLHFVYFYISSRGPGISLRREWVLVLQRARQFS